MSERTDSDGNRCNEGNANSVNRRQFVRSLGVAGGAATFGIFGVGNAAADENPHIDSFNPDDKQEVTRAVIQANKFENESAYVKNLENLTAEQREALFEANSIHAIEETANKEIESSENNGDFRTQGYGTFFTARYNHTVKGVNVAGQPQIKFVHHVRFKFNGDRVKDLNHFKTVGTGGFGWRFDRVTTKRAFRVDNGLYGVLIMKGKFSQCPGGRFGCVNSRVIGSKIRALRQGGVDRKVLRG